MKIYNIFKELIKEEEEEPKNGFHTEYYYNRTKKSKIHYFDGVPDGHAEYYYDNGEVYEEGNN
jgi:antitoxin component YwqK of YwqJK toxin-antitoxin module